MAAHILGGGLVNVKVDVKTVQEMLRHQNLETTFEVYAKAMSEEKLTAQGMSSNSGDKADHISGCNYADVILVIVEARCWHAERPLASVRLVSSISL